MDLLCKLVNWFLNDENIWGNGLSDLFMNEPRQYHSEACSEPY